MFFLSTSCGRPNLMTAVSPVVGFVDDDDVLGCVSGGAVVNVTVICGLFKPYCAGFFTSSATNFTAFNPVTAERSDEICPESPGIFLGSTICQFSPDLMSLSVG